MNRLYRALLRAYPLGFRREYGAEMCDIFAERAAARGLGGRIWLLFAAVSEVLGNALLLHWELLRQDLRYMVRSWRSAPGFAVTAVLVIALGVGANTAAFSVADFVLVRPLPYPDAESLVRVCAGPRTGPSGWGCMNQLSPADYRDLKEQTTSFSGLGAFRRDAVNLVGEGEPQRLSTALVTDDVLPLLGVAPIAGRWFDPVSAPDGRAVVISYGLWQAHFGGEHSVLGRTLDLDGAPHVVTGVMPPGFHFPTRDVQLWTPLRLVEEDYADRGNNYLEAVGRLTHDATFDLARADLDVVVERLAREFPETNDETGVSFFRLRDEFSPRFRLMLRALCAASICILLLACANLGALLLARAGSRERELAVRAALGAGRERLVRQMMTESIALAVLGGAAGVVVALLAFPLLSLLIPSTLPIGSEPVLNPRVLALAAAFTVLTGLGFGLVPAMRTSRDAALVALRGGRASGRRQRLRSMLVGFQVAVAALLLVSTSLLMRAMLRVQATDPGFRTEGVLTMRTVLPKPKYLSAERREQFYRDVLAEVRSLPGVEAAAYISGVPMIMYGGITRVVLPGQEIRPDGDYLVSRRYTTPQLFRALQIPLINGRDLEDADADGHRRVAVVSQRFVERYWPDGDALGKAFLFQDSLYTVVGVVGDIRMRGLERVSEPQMYLPTTRVGDGPLNFYDPKDLIVRTTRAPASILPSIRAIIRSADPDQPVSDVQTMTAVLEQQTAPRAAQVRVLLALAALAVLLAGIGIHGLLAYTVGQQRQEIGVRLALGEVPGRVARRVVRNGVVLALYGMVPGLLLAFAAGRWMSSMLFGVQPGDPLTFAMVAVLCLATSVTGALVPALRAVRVSPLTVMRVE